jgi:hypothetical protein
MNRSKERHTFQAENYIKRCEETGEEPSEDYLNMYEGAKARDLARAADQEWKKNNLEYDLRSTEWICNKAKASDAYAQNIYAALCNQDWQKNEVWPLLKGEHWGCSWRYAGGIVADMREQGDYIDWYCSGIKGNQDTHDDGSVPESHVTEEIQEDFFRLGWIPVDSGDE